MQFLKNDLSCKCLILALKHIYLPFISMPYNKPIQIIYFSKFYFKKLTNIENILAKCFLEFFLMISFSPGNEILSFYYLLYE